MDHHLCLKIQFDYNTDPLLYVLPMTPFNGRVQQLPQRLRDCVDLWPFPEKKLAASDCVPFLLICTDQIYRSSSCYYRLNVCATSPSHPPNHILKSNPHCDDIRRRTFGKWLDHDGLALIKDLPCLFCPVKTWQKDNCQWARKQTLIR